MARRRNKNKSVEAVETQPIGLLDKAMEPEVVETLPDSAPMDSQVILVVGDGVALGKFISLILTDPIIPKMLDTIIVDSIVYKIFNRSADGFVTELNNAMDEGFAYLVDLFDGALFSGNSKIKKESYPDNLIAMLIEKWHLSNQNLAVIAYHQEFKTTKRDANGLGKYLVVPSWAGIVSSDWVGDIRAVQTQNTIASLSVLRNKNTDAMLFELITSDAKTLKTSKKKCCGG